MSQPDPIRNQRPELAVIDVATMRGLEIGPLTSPRIRKSEGPVFYLDHVTTDELRAKYAENERLRPSLDSIVDVDFVQREGTSLTEVFEDEVRFDYVLASHVIEHVPNVIGWLMEISEILRPGGFLSLVAPDKRFCFDVNRTPTEMSELVDAYLRDLRHPSSRQIFDFMSRVVTIDGAVDTPGIWAGTADYAGVVRSDVGDPEVAAFQVCLEHHQFPDHPIDIHCHVFTPTSFVHLLAQMMNLELMDFEVASFLSTPRDQLEFFVSLQKSTELSPERRRERQLASIPEDIDEIPATTGATSTNGDAPREFIVSEREQRLILAKRRVVEGLRRRSPWQSTPSSC